MAQFPAPSFRQAEEADLPRILEVHLASYPDARGIELRRRNFTANPLGELSDLVVAEVNGDIVAQGFCFPLEAWFGGAKVRVGGIASLAVAPEARRRGLGRALMGQLHAVSDM